MAARKAKGVVSGPRVRSVTIPGKVWKGNRDLGALLVPVSELEEDPENARLHPEDNMGAIRQSLDMFGQARTIATWRDPSTGALLVIAGNGTFRAAESLGWDHVAATEFEGDKHTARAYAIADNRASELSSWNAPVLAAQMAEIEEHWRAEDVSGSWSPAEVIGFSAAPEPVAERPARDRPERERAAAAAIDVEATPVPASADIEASAGDLFLVDQHRVLCGDFATAKALLGLLSMDTELLRASPFALSESAAALVVLPVYEAVAAMSDWQRRTGRKVTKA